MIKKISVLLLAVMLLSGCSNIKTVVKTEGYHGTVSTQITIDHGRIQQIEVVESEETEEVVNEPLKQLISDIIEYQSVNVDTMAGATETCNAVKEAVREAAVKADIKDIEKDFLHKNRNKEVLNSTADVVVIGSGGAGLSAAVMAARNGSEVTVIEKMSKIGGNTYRATAMYNCVDEELQHPLGIYDTEEIFFNETFEGGHGVAKPELVRIMTSQADEGKEFLEELGLEFEDRIDNCLGGEHARGHFSKAENGSDYIGVLKKECDRLGVKILLNCPAEKIIQNENGEIAGVKAQWNGQSTVIECRQGVVIASGGFGNNVEMRMKYDHTLTGELLCSNTTGTTGDGLIMAAEVGANLINMEYIECYPMADIRDGGLMDTIPNAINQGILVNSTGNRFIREDAARDALAEQIRKQQGNMVVSVTDNDFSDQEKDHEFVEGLIYMGAVQKADTLSELAEKCGFDKKEFLKTVEEYNKGVERQQDPFNRITNKNKIDNPPYYANYKTISVHHTLGGIEINEHAQVLDRNGNTINRLYAAGEVTGGIHGANRLGGNSFPDIIVFGRIAGTHVSQEISRN